MTLLDCIGFSWMLLMCCQLTVYYNHRYLPRVALKSSPRAEAQKMHQNILSTQL